MKAEIQNQYLVYVLLLEVSLSLTSLKCFWLEAAEDTGLLLTQILSTPFVDSACTVTQHIDVKALIAACWCQSQQQFLLSFVKSGTWHGYLSLLLFLAFRSHL